MFISKLNIVQFGTKENAITFYSLPIIVKSSITFPFIFIFAFKNLLLTFCLFILVTERLLIFKNLVCQLFSRKCQLVSLRLDIPDGVSLIRIYNSSFWCYGRAINLRYLHIRIHNKYFLHVFIEHAPNLERLSVHLEGSWVSNEFLDSSCDRFRKSNKNYSDEVRQLHDYSHIKLFFIVEIVPTEVKMFHSKRCPYG